MLLQFVWDQVSTLLKLPFWMSRKAPVGLQSDITEDVSGTCTLYYPFWVFYCDLATTLLEMILQLVSPNIGFGIFWDIFATSKKHKKTFFRLLWCSFLGRVKLRIARSHRWIWNPEFKWSNLHVFEMPKASHHNTCISHYRRRYLQQNLCTRER